MCALVDQHYDMLLNAYATNCFALSQDMTYKV